MTNNPNIIRFRENLQERAKGQQEYAKRTYEQWTTRAYKELERLQPALQNQRAGIESHLDHPESTFTDAIRKDFRGKLEHLDRYLPGAGGIRGPDEQRFNFHPGYLITEIYRTREWLATVQQSMLAGGNDRGSARNRLAIADTLSYLLILERACGVPPFPQTIGYPRQEHPRVQKMRKDTAILARTGVAVLAGLGAVTTGTLAALGNKGNWPIAGLYAFVAYVAAKGKGAFASRGDRQLEQMQHFGQIDFLTGSAYERLRATYDIKGGKWAALTEELKGRPPALRKYLKATREQERLEARQELIDALGGSSLPPSFLRMVDNQPDLTQFIALTGQVTDSQARSVLLEYITQGVSVSAVRTMGVGI